MYSNSEKFEHKSPLACLLYDHISLTDNQQSIDSISPVNMHQNNENIAFSPLNLTNQSLLSENMDDSKQNNNIIQPTNLINATIETKEESINLNQIYKPQLNISVCHHIYIDKQSNDIGKCYICITFYLPLFFYYSFYV